VRCCRSCWVSCRIQQRHRRERRQAALELGQYFLPRKPTLKRSQRGKLIRDQYGFEVDPNVARELRDTKLKLACLPLSKRKFTPYAMAQKASKLHVRIKEIQQSLQCPCPSTYKLKDKFDDTDIDGQIVRDKDRLKFLGKRRVDKKMFTPEEDLEEAILTARYDSFTEGPEMADERVQSCIRKGIEEGAEVLVGDEGHPQGLEAGYFVKATVFVM
jgi:hypothetical protein